MRLTMTPVMNQFLLTVNRKKEKHGTDSENAGVVYQRITHSSTRAVRRT